MGIFKYIKEIINKYIKIDKKVKVDLTVSIDIPYYSGGCDTL